MEILLQHITLKISNYRQNFTAFPCFSVKIGLWIMVTVCYYIIVK
jgi:hypothetical protein